jgi:hypothetical protein
MHVIKKNIDDHNMVMKTTPQAVEKITMKLFMSRQKTMSHTQHGLCR